MSYRDDDDALRAYHDDLERELSRLETQVASLTSAEREQKRIASELERVRTELDGRARRRAPVRLEELRIASPCREEWDNMTGDDLVRHCGKCDKLVFDLSQMSTEEAEILVSTHTGTRLCTRLWRRADGKVMTQDCPDRGRQKKIVAAVAAGIAAAGIGAAAFAASLAGAKAANGTVESIAMPADAYAVGGASGVGMGSATPAPSSSPPNEQVPHAVHGDHMMGGVSAPPKQHVMGHVSKTDRGH